ncbi:MULTISPECIES: YqgQ family protein [Bacillaceae]|uniref:YqgQ family protein n=1 Tax=Bacillaceae TaxID=186817 RepID=UPI0005559F42|nr:MULTISPECIES: YqgQ family protein [Bacillaceae]UOE95735.1 YqgQ family protein [Alkalihalobacillus sp. LMS39]
MNSFYDVQQLLKRYGTIIYTKNRETDIMMMEEELRELYKLSMLDAKTYQQGILILKNELQKEG